MIRDNLRILRWSATSALADLRTIYTWKTWTGGWLVRILAQVSFFALIGRLLGSTQVVHFLLVGNAVYVAASTAMFVVASTSWERMAGTLPLLVAAPAHPFTVFAGRSVQWLADGVAVSAVALFALGAAFGLPFAFPRALLAIPLLLLVASSVYCFGLVLAGIALRVMGLRNVVGNIGHLSLMILCGVQVPVTFWPGPVQAVSNVLPLRHGLAAIRAVVSGSGPVLAEAARELAVGLGWLVVAGLVFRRLAEGGRKDGSIEFGG